MFFRATRVRLTDTAVRSERVQKENFWSVSENQPFPKHVILGGLMSGGLKSGGRLSGGRLSGGLMSYDHDAYTTALVEKLKSSDGQIGGKDIERILISTTTVVFEETSGKAAFNEEES